MNGSCHSIRIEDRLLVSVFDLKRAHDPPARCPGLPHSEWVRSATRSPPWRIRFAGDLERRREAIGEYVRFE